MNIRERRKMIAENLQLENWKMKLFKLKLKNKQPSMFDMFQGSGMEQMGMNMQDALGNLMPKKTKKRKLTCKRCKKSFNTMMKHKN